jgi:hypothetical protein
VRVAPLTVGRGRSRFLAHRIDRLFDEPRAGAPRKITDADVERVVAKALDSTPEQRNPLALPVARQGDRHEPGFDQLDLPGVCRRAASTRDVQASACNKSLAPIV